MILACALIAVVDGDTVKCDGESLRLIGDGEPHKLAFDTPETYQPDCEEERVLGEAATTRLKELIADLAWIEDTGEKGRYGRPLVRVWINTSTGERTVGSIMLDEGRAQIWTPGAEIDWCG